MLNRKKTMMGLFMAGGLLVGRNSMAQDNATAQATMVEQHVPENIFLDDLHTPDDDRTRDDLKRMYYRYLVDIKKLKNKSDSTGIEEYGLISPLPHGAKVQNTTTSMRTSLRAGFAREYQIVVLFNEKTGLPERMGTNDISYLTAESDSMHIVQTLKTYDVAPRQHAKQISEEVRLAKRDIILHQTKTMDGNESYSVSSGGNTWRIDANGIADTDGNTDDGTTRMTKFLKTMRDINGMNKDMAQRPENQELVTHVLGAFAERVTPLIHQYQTAMTVK